MSSYLTQYREHPGRSLAGDLAPWILIITVMAIFAVGLMRFYLYVNRPNVDLHGESHAFLYIPTGSDLKKVKQLLTEKGYLKNTGSFQWLSMRKHYDQKIKPGRYRLSEGMSNNALINLLRSGRQEPVRITLQSARTREELAGKIGRHLETDSVSLLRLFNNQNFLNKYGLTPATLFVLFIPNTYEMFWNTSGDQLFERMMQEYSHFWTVTRKNKAGALNLTVAEVVTLASIIEKETNKNDEKPIMAGVYINRLRKEIPLQADPTIIYAWNDYSIKRVLIKHTEIKSPYNTYLHSGLPPGPICIPSVASVDAVLNRQAHNYLYFCAKEDLSGYHNFAATLAEHNQNARRYQAALNKLNIR